MIADDNDDDDGPDQEQTSDNKALFSEIQLSGETAASASHESTLDIDLRLTRLRRSASTERRVSSSQATESDSVADMEKVSRGIATRMSFASIVFFVQHFPGLADKRDRLQLIDYDQLSFNNGLKLPLASDLPRGSQSTVSRRQRPFATDFFSLQISRRSKLILPEKTIYVHVKTLNEGQSFVRRRALLSPCVSSLCFALGLNRFALSQSAKSNLG